MSDDIPENKLEAMVAYRRAYAALDPIRFQFWDHRGLTMTQLRVMSLIYREGGQPAGQIAEALGVRAPTVTGLTDRLVRHGLIQRAADPEDRRVVRIELTAEGERVLGEMTAAGRAFLSTVLDEFSDEEVATLTDLLTRLADRADALHRKSEFQP